MKPLLRPNTNSSNNAFGGCISDDEQPNPPEGTYWSGERMGFGVDFEDCGWAFQSVSPVVTGRSISPPLRSIYPIQDGGVLCPS